MVWTRRKGDLELVDSKIVKEGFIIARGGQTVGPYFLEKDKNPFKRDFYIPVFYLFKVHRNHPLRILSSEINYVDIYPKNHGKINGKFRMPAEVYRDKMDYDLTTFLLSPFDVDESEISSWEKYPLKESFISIDSERRDGCLLYLEHGLSIHSQDHLLASEVLSSQIMLHFFDWMYRGDIIISHDQTFDRKLEGRIEVPVDTAREVTAEVSRILETRYKTRLLFDRYKLRYPNVFEKG